jgi:hypothetical protein
MTPQQLDAQSLIHIDEWVDLDSERWREVDDDPALTKKFLRILLQDPPALIADDLGRLWGKGKEGRMYPYHLEYGRKLIGIRIAKKALN